MPSLPVAPNCLRIKLQGKVGTNPLVHIMHAQYSGGTPATADCIAIANAVRTSWNTRMAPMVTSGAVYNSFEVLDLGSLTGAVGVNSTAVTGTRAGGAVPPLSAAAVISWKVAYRFRGGHCRTYIPLGSTTDYASGNALTTGYTTALASAATGFLTDFNTITTGTLTIALAMLSYYQHGQLRPTPQPYLISTATVHGRVDTIRRRLGKEF